MRKYSKLLALNCLLPLLICLVIYVLFRSHDTVVNRFLFGNFIAEPIRFNSFWSEIIIYNLPGALWLYAFVYFNSIYSKSWFSRLAPLALALGIELVQLLKITDGTFDSFDVFFYLASWILCNLSIAWRDHGKPDPDQQLNFKRATTLAYTFFIAIVFLSDIWHH